MDNLDLTIFAEIAAQTDNDTAQDLLIDLNQQKQD